MNGLRIEQGVQRRGRSRQRLAIGSNHLDSAARFGHVNAVEAMRRVQGTNRWTVSYEDIVNADCLLLIGTQITWTNPIAGLKVKEAVKKHGAKLLTIEAMQPSIETTSNIANLSTTHLTVEVGRHPAAVHGLLKAVFDEGVADNHLAATASGYVDRTRAAVSALPYPEGMDEATLRTIARTFAGSRRGVILIGQDLLQSPGGYEASVNLMDLLLLLGKLSEKGWGLAPLTEENNEQGAIEMGATADYFPGAASLDDAAARTRIASAWKESPPVGAGMRMLDMLEAARSGKLKAMLIVGENPARTLPASAKPAEALGRLEFLVVQELFLTETAKLAHVVLPASSYAEKSGSFTNSEGCVQKVRAGLEPLGGSRPDWEILSAVSVLMGYPLEYGDAAEILKEIRAVIPGYRVLGATPEPARVDRPAMDRYVGGGFQRGAPVAKPGPGPERGLVRQRPMGAVVGDPGAQPPVDAACGRRDGHAHVCRRRSAGAGRRTGPHSSGHPLLSRVLQGGDCRSSHDDAGCRDRRAVPQTTARRSAQNLVGESD